MPKRGRLRGAQGSGFFTAEHRSRNPVYEERLQSTTRSIASRLSAWSAGAQQVAVSHGSLPGAGKSI
jgi:hypothetical protein